MAVIEAELPSALPSTFGWCLRLLGLESTYEALEALQAKQQGVKDHQLACASRRLSADYVHGPVLAEGYARVHAPPLVVVLQNHHHALQYKMLAEAQGKQSRIRIWRGLL